MTDTHDTYEQVSARLFSRERAVSARLRDMLAGPPRDDYYGALVELCSALAYFETDAAERITERIAENRRQAS